MAGQESRYLVLPEIAARLRILPEKVLGWIRRGELRAINVSNRNRPRYRISPDDLDVFLKRREVQPRPRISRRRRMPPVGEPLDPELGKKLTKEGKARFACGQYYRVWNGIALFY